MLKNGKLGNDLIMNDIIDDIDNVDNYIIVKFLIAIVYDI